MVYVDFCKFPNCFVPILVFLTDLEVGTAFGVLRMPDATAFGVLRVPDETSTPGGGPLLVSLGCPTRRPPQPNRATGQKSLSGSG